MDTQLLKEYREVSEKIGKCYSDLEALEARRAQLENVIHNNGFTATTTSFEAPRPTKHVDKHAVEKTTTFLKHHFIANKICTPEMLVKEFGCTTGAATARLRKAADRKEGKLSLGPLRLEKI